jgi:hypothetical protein
MYGIWCFPPGTIRTVCLLALLIICVALLMWWAAGCEPRSPVDLCHPWCARIAECVPDAVGSVEECAQDCQWTYRNTEVAEVSGFTRDDVECLVHADSCSEALQCR